MTSGNEVGDNVWEVVSLGRWFAKKYRKRAMVPLVRIEIVLDVQRHKGAWLWHLQVNQKRKLALVILECIVGCIGPNG